MIMMLIFSLARVSNKRFENPGMPTIPLPCNVNNEMSLTLLMPFIGLLEPLLMFCVISVPVSSGAKVFFIRMGMFLFNTGNTVGGYKTFAPKCDSSTASK